MCCSTDAVASIDTGSRICSPRSTAHHALHAAISGAFAGENVGIREVAENIWLVSFMQYDLGFFDHQSGRIECAPNPFDARVLPMCPE